MTDLVIDITRLLDRFLQGRLATGVDRVNLEYIRYFQSRATAVVRFGGRWIQFDRQDSRRLFLALLERPSNFKALVRWLVGRAYVFGYRARSEMGRFLLNAGHSGLDLPEYANRVRASGLTPLFVVYDLIPITHPEYCRPGEDRRHVARMNTVLNVGRGVICISEATLNDLQAFASCTGQSMPDTTVALLAPTVMPVPQAEPPLEKPYFVVLGTIEPRKNHLLLLNVWRQLVAQYGEATPRLVVIGQRGWECENVVDMLERCQALRGVVVEHPGCSDAELATYLRHAQALLFPSFTEGFGMPLVEALAFGTPVIASDLPVFREIAGEVPDYLSPLDGLGWLRMIEAYAQPGAGVRAAQLARMAGYRPPEWRLHFQQVENLLERLGK